ncbi:MAG: hypothetical protein ACPGU7_07080 [Gammaproteobacteria bacterium]
MEPTSVQIFAFLTLAMVLLAALGLLTLAAEAMERWRSGSCMTKGMAKGRPMATLIDADAERPSLRA